MNTNTKFIKPDSILFQAGLTPGQTVADLGAGSGFYTIAAGVIVGSQGTVYAIDIKEPSLDHLSAEARMRGLKNVKTFHCDLDEEKLHSRIPEGECDLVLMGNILHEISHKKNLLNHAYRLLKTGGRLVIIDWNSTPGPVGPKSEKRLSESEAKRVTEESAFRFVKNIEADQYHYCLVFER